MAAITRALKSTGDLMLGKLRPELLDRKHEGPANIAVNVNDVFICIDVWNWPMVAVVLVMGGKEAGRYSELVHRSCPELLTSEPNSAPMALDSTALR